MGKSETSVPIQVVKEGCCSARDVLWYLVFFGFAVNYMIRINLNIALVSMVEPKTKNTNTSFTSECISELVTDRPKFISLSEDDVLLRQNLNQSRNPLGPHVEEDHRSHKFDWSEKLQGSVLGSFFWLHWVTQVPGGLLAAKYGTKMVFGLANFSGVILCFAIPYCAILGVNYLITLRIVQGFILGFAWPSMHHMTARWIPPNERSKFVTAYLGSSVGVALTYPICGFIIDRWGWPTVFYVCGLFGTLWFITWWVLVYDSPAEHPRISPKEKEYILSSLGQSVAHKTEKVPWIKILTNSNVLLIILAQFGGTWGLFTLMTHAPTYFKFIHGWNIRATGFLSGMPHVFRMLWAYIFSQFGDYLLRTNKMSRTNVRKLATAVCCAGQGVFMLGLAYSGCDRTAAIVFLTAAVAANGAVSTGPLASIVDISPNYASIILGFTNAVVACAGFFVPMVAGHLTNQNQTVGQWQKVFWVSSFWLFTSGILYSIFAQSELQSWNSPSTAKKEEPQIDEAESELMIIKNKKNKESDKDIEKN